MKTSWYQHDGIWFYEVIYKSNKKLRDLAECHRKLGRKTWVNAWDYEKNEWILTVEMGKTRETRI